MGLAKNLFLVFLICPLLLLKVDSKCPRSFQCGRVGSLRFPFSEDPKCGLFVVNGCDSGNPGFRLISSEWSSYNILLNISTNKLLLFNPKLQEQLNDRNCLSLGNLSLPQSSSVSFTFSPNLTFFRCSNQTSNKDIQDYFQNYQRLDCPIRPPPTVYYRNPTIDVPNTDKTIIPATCSMIQLPINSSKNSSELFDLLTAEFTLEWNVSETCYQCYNGGGQCLSDHNNKFYCKKEGKSRLKIILTGTLVSATMLVVFLVICRKYKRLDLLGDQKAKSANEKDIELFLKNNGNLAQRRFKYSEIKKITNSFSESLGKGGYGSVYKGKLPDGRLVAVKILNECEGNGEEFVNEVASISRTSHINIVTLLGFCFEGSKRALIYDFMPNGSLDNFTQNTASSSAQGGLAWQKLLEIALGTARGLEYLHQGCNTRILHFDIKPHNILLDKDLNPRISDFGLAKLCPNRSSIVSMLVARGTTGYIAPEVFSRSFGEVSHKSDVYSYGMMVLEIAGGRKNDPRDVDHTSEIYFPQHIYKQLEMDVERNGNLAGIMTENESQSAKTKLIIVGLWCIQTDPRDRPSMTKVVEMLEGKLESLQVPPRPYLYSPPRTEPKLSTSEST